VAGLLLSTPDEDLDISSRKVKALCLLELVQARDLGTIGTICWSISAFMRVRMRPDVRVNEQYNSLVRMMNERCRHVSLGLLSARVNLKKMLGVGTRGASMKWSQIRPRAEILLNQMMQHGDEADTVMGETDRWQPPLPAAPLVNVDALIDLCLPVPTTPAMVWGTHYSLELHKFLPIPEATILIILTDGEPEDVPAAGSPFTALETDNPAYFIAETNYNTSRLVPCTVERIGVPGQDDSKLIAKVKTPFTTTSSIQAFGEAWPFFHMDGVAREISHLLRITVSRHDMVWKYSDDHGLHAEVYSIGTCLFALQRRPVVTPSAKRRAKRRPRDWLAEVSSGSSSDEDEADGGGGDVGVVVAHVAAAGDGDDHGGGVASGSAPAGASGSGSTGPPPLPPPPGPPPSEIELALVAEFRCESEVDLSRQDWIDQDKRSIQEELVRKLEKDMVDAVLRTALSDSDGPDRTKAVSTVVRSADAVASLLSTAAHVDIDAEHDSAIFDAVAFDGSARSADDAGHTSSTIPPVIQEGFELVWRSQFTQGRQILRDAQVACRTLEVGRTAAGPWELSLLVPPPELSDRHKSPVFVQWSLPSRRKGRPVRVNAVPDGTLTMYEAVWPIGAAHTYQDWEIAHPAVGVTMKCSRTERSCLSLKMITLRRMWETAMSHGIDASLDASCLACGSRGPSGSLPAMPDFLSGECTVDTFTCAICLCTWHTECCSRVLTTMGLVAPSELSEASWLPTRLFPSALCGLCKSHVCTE
jgi:hypothetical protein